MSVFKNILEIITESKDDTPNGYRCKNSQDILDSLKERPDIWTGKMVNGKFTRVSKDSVKKAIKDGKQLSGLIQYSGASAGSTYMTIKGLD
jgi:hypothetical protein